MKLELILFTMNDRLYGIESSEIIKVVTIDNANNGSHLSGKEEVIFANTLLDPAGHYTYKTALMIKTLTKNGIVLYIPVLEDLITIPESDIIPVPDLLKKYQTPFFVWGVCESHEKMIVLITFDYYFS